MTAKSPARKPRAERRTAARLDAEAVSRPVMTSVAAGVIGIHQRHLIRLREEGWIKQDSYGKVLLADAVQGYIRSLKEKGPTRDSARMALTDAQRRKVLLQVRRASGELVPLSMVDETLQGLSTEFVGQIEGLPSRLANELAGISDPAVARSRLLEEVRRIRASVASWLQRRAEALGSVPDGGDDLGSAENADADGVGGGEPDVSSRKRGAGPVQGKADALLRADPGRGGGPKVQEGRRGNGHADG